nr:immunoglobulin heavy chain junction region [Macaca mulatta]
CAVGPLTNFDHW